VADDYQPFAHLAAPNAALYRQVMAAFAQAKRQFVVHLRPDDVIERIVERGESAPDGVTEALSQLVAWGNLHADPDTGRVTTVEDFHRARYLYQLTARGEAAEQALVTYDEALGRRGALQAVALADIASQLRALLELARQPGADPGKTYLLLRSLVDRFSDLADNAQAFMGSLQRTIDLHDADAEAFRAYKDRLIDYLERFIADLVTTGAEITGLIGELGQADIARLLGAAARREAEDAAPGGLADPDDAREQEFHRAHAVWQERWTGLSRWFVSTSGHPSQAKLLRARARAAIPQLLAVVASLNSRRSGHSDRSADLRTLAVWFAQAPDDASRHRLWRSAFGLGSARHLTADADDGASAPSSASWSAAPAVVISPQLRRTGSYERRGKPNQVIDRSEHIRYLTELAAQQAAQTAAARARLATARPIRLSELGPLEPDEFGLFLGLLGDALAARRPGQRAVCATTADGTMQVTLTVLDTHGTAEIQTPDGVFRGPDHLVDILDLTVDAVQERSA